MSRASPKYGGVPYAPYTTTPYSETPYTNSYAENPYEWKPSPIYASAYEPEADIRRGRKDSGTWSRHASRESIRSAPDSEAVARRRQQSRTLSEERPALVDRSYDGGRGEGVFASDGETRRRSNWIMWGLRRRFLGREARMMTGHI
jgi:hypothetical protein